MHRITGWLLAVLLLLALPAAAQTAPDLAGQWQGTVNAGAALRMVVKFAHGEGGKLTGQLYSIDQTPQPIALTELVQNGAAVTFTLVKGQGMALQLSPDGQSLQGNLSAAGVAIPVSFARAAEATAWAIPDAGDATAHKIQMVPVADKVQVEVVDWGGSGRPLVFLAGLGATAHVFDRFAPRFLGQYHVYGVTRRGYGASSKPDASIAVNYAADRLGDDVLAVLAALKLDHPVLVGWSIAGEELSSIATRHPEAVGGLVYLDAASQNALYTPGLGSSFSVSIPDLRAKLAAVNENPYAPANAAALDRLLVTDLPQMTADLRRLKADIIRMQKLSPAAPAPPAMAPVGAAVMAGAQKYGPVKPPVLAIYALPQIGKDMPASVKPMMEEGVRQADEMIRAYQKANPQAKVMRIVGARHDIFQSNPDDVADAMNVFLMSLH